MATTARAPVCSAVRQPIGAPQRRLCAAQPLRGSSRGLPAALMAQPTLQRRQARQLACVAAEASSSSGAGEAGAVAPAAAAAAAAGRHAFLHDFCMCIPYGALLLVGGLAARVCGWGQPAAVMAVVGALQVALSNLSLKAWRAGKSAAPFTLVEAGLAGWLAYYAYRAVQQGVSSLVMGTLLGLSAAMALFLAYNVASGGNPPRRGSHAPPAAAAAPASS